MKTKKAEFRITKWELSENCKAEIKKHCQSDGVSKDKVECFLASVQRDLNECHSLFTTHNQTGWDHTSLRRSTRRIHALVAALRRMDSHTLTLLYDRYLSVEIDHTRNVLLRQCEEFEKHLQPQKKMRPVDWERVELIRLLIPCCECYIGKVTAGDKSLFNVIARDILQDLTDNPSGVTIGSQRKLIKRAIETHMQFQRLIGFMRRQK
jgi:hypothetical protein